MNKRKKGKAIPLLIFVLLMALTSSVFSYPTGITGVTKKTSTTGCYCHTNNTNITGLITGPDTVNPGQAVTYTITVTRSGSSAKSGCDIAVRLGSLSIISGQQMQLLNSELTHTTGWTLTSGTVSKTFTYTAPAAAGTDTIWSNVVAGYSNGFNWSPEKRIIIRNPSAIIKLSEEVPSIFSLGQNYPNPFNPTTKIKFTIPENSNVTLNIHDVTGKIIATPLSGNLSPGIYEYEFNATSLSSGIYFYTLKSKNFQITKKMIISK